MADADADLVPERELVMVGVPLTVDDPDGVGFEEVDSVLVLVVDDVDVLELVAVLDGEVVAVADLEDVLVLVTNADAVILADTVDVGDGRDEPVSVRVKAAVADSERLPFAVAEAETVPMDVAERLAGAVRVEVGLGVIVET